MLAALILETENAGAKLYNRGDGNKALFNFDVVLLMKQNKKLLTTFDKKV